MTVYVLVPYENLDISQLPSPSGGHASQLPSHGGGGHPSQGLPGQGGHPDQSLPGGGWKPTDPGFGQGGNRPGQLPSHGGWNRPDNALPGVDKPVDPEYGTDPKPPGSPDQGLPMPQPRKPFTDEEKHQIMELAEKKFVHTELSPMRCIVQAARWVLVTRKQDSGAQPGRPDNSLPGQPNRPDHSLPGQPARPDHSLPTPPPTAGQPLPGTPPGTPDQGLPPAPGQLPTTPPTAQPKSTY